MVASDGWERPSTREPMIGIGAGSASIDLPAGGEWAACVEAGTVSWAFEEHDFAGKLVLRDRVRLKRFTSGAMKSVQPCNVPLRMYAGGGVAAYRYEYAQGVAVTRGGAHV